MTSMTTPPKEQAPDTLRTHFEALASDPSFKLRRSRRGTYVNPAVARDWKWFQLGASQAQQPGPARATPYPMVGDEDESELGDWQDGATKPTIEGTYLREFDEGPATSEFYEGKWLRDGFFPSDIQDARWRGRNEPAPAPKPAPVLDMAVMQLAESVGLIGPASRVGDLHAAIQRFHDLICVNATIKAAVMAADVIRGAATPARDYPPLPMQFACSGALPVYSADQMRAYVDADRAARGGSTP